MLNRNGVFVLFVVAIAWLSAILIGLHNPKRPCDLSKIDTCAQTGGFSR